jgi:hypothetical protein
MIQEFGGNHAAIRTRMLVIATCGSGKGKTTWQEKFSEVGMKVAIQTFYGKITPKQAKDFVTDDGITEQLSWHGGDLIDNKRWELLDLVNEKL